MSLCLARGRHACEENEGKKKRGFRGRDDGVTDLDAARVTRARFRVVDLVNRVRVRG